MAYASGKEAYGICDITGFRYNLREMKMTWDGLLVGSDQWSPKHPQIDRKSFPADPQSLKNARPDTSDDNSKFLVYTNVGNGMLGSVLDTFEVASSVGEVTIEIT
jgi:hypothetical protein|tara:strand:- start:615 stop:929 length:315 start_codon:yes stop_codon:yes gene_type:complete